MRDDFEEHRLQLAIDLLGAGFAASLGTVYDGQFLFDSDHSDGPGLPTQSNVTTAVLSETSFRAAQTTMWQWVKPNGKMANVNPDTLIIPPSLNGTAQDLFMRNIDANGATNMLFGAVKVIVEPRLEAQSSTAWYLLDSTKRVKPIVMGNRKAVQFRAAVNPNEGHAFERDELRFGADGRYNAGYGYWQAIYGSDGTV